MTSYLKMPIWRSEKWLAAMREIPCQHCGRSERFGDIVAAHRNEGKGKAIKVSDALVAALCYRCHTDLDQGAKMRREERREMWDLAFRQTLKSLYLRGMVAVLSPGPFLILVDSEPIETWQRAIESGEVCLSANKRELRW